MSDDYEELHPRHSQTTLPPVLDFHHAVLFHRVHLFDCPPEYDALLFMDGDIRAMGKCPDVMKKAVKLLGIEGEFHDKDLQSPNTLGAALMARQGIEASEYEAAHLPFLRVYDGGRKSKDDAGGWLVCPGFVDAHVHLFDAGRRKTGLSLRDCTSKEAFRKAVKMAASVAPKGAWLFGGDWDDEKLGGTPDRSWIDDVTTENPVLLARFDSHTALANTVALKKADVDPSKSREIEGGEFESYKDSSKGLTGIVRESALHFIRKAVPAHDTVFGMGMALTQAAKELVSHGYTGVHTMTSLDFHNVREIQLLEAAASSGRLPIRVAAAVRHSELPWAAKHARGFHAHRDQQYDNPPSSPSGSEAADETAHKKHAGSPCDHCGSGPAFGRNAKGRYSLSRWVRVLGVKIFLDGSLGSRTAYFLEDYHDHQGRGFTELSDEELLKVIADCDNAGLMVMAHAIGDAAVSQLLCQLEKYASELRPRKHRGRPLQLRIEHCQHISDDDLERLKRLTARNEHTVSESESDIPEHGDRIRDINVRIVASMQPTHSEGDSHDVVKGIGKERAAKTFRYASLKDAGATLCFGSDWMVMPPRPIDTIIAATRPPEPFSPSEAVSVADAIRAFTVGPALAARWDREFGRLRVGGAADLTVLSRNIAAKSAKPVEKDEDLIAFTIVDGLIRYEK